MLTLANLKHWEIKFEAYLAQATGAGDVAHDLEHVRRVVANAVALTEAEGGCLAVTLPAAWLHDCVIIPKDSPWRSRASTLAAQAAVSYLESLDYPVDYLADIHHAIAAHSFSAQIAPKTLEAMIVQDADRLDALGAIGVARCLMLSGALNRRLYDPHEPFSSGRTLDDTTNTLDHFYTKLLHLGEQMNTPAGRAAALPRTAFLRAFLSQLEDELPRPKPTA